MKKILTLVLLMTLITLTFSGCINIGNLGNNPSGETDGEPGGEPVDYTMFYRDLLDEFYYLILNPDVEVEYDQGKFGVVETAMSMGTNEALNTIGYHFKDINSDGVEELLIGVFNEYDGAYTKNNLLAVFTIKDNKPLYVLEGRSRSSYSLIDDGKIYYGGSNGAMYRIFGLYELVADGQLKSNEYYFSYHKGNDYENIGFYYNTTGEYDTSHAEELYISQDEFFAKEDSFAKRSVEVAFEPFSSLKKDGDTPAPEPEVSVDFVGNWICTAQAGGGESYVLFVDILEDGTASYRCGPPESEIMVDCNGSWQYDAKGKILSLDLIDSYEGFGFKGTYRVSVGSGSISLTHIDGDAFLYGTEGKTFDFTVKGW